MPPNFLIFFSPSSRGSWFSPFSSLVNSSKSCSGVNFSLHCSSVPKSSGMGKKGMMGACSMSYVSTLSSISRVFERASGMSWKTSFISSRVLNHSCFEYSIRVGSSRSLPVERHSRWS